MGWVTPQYTRSQVDAAGRTLAKDLILDPSAERALDVVNNWRSAHSFPLNTMQVRLRTAARSIDIDALVAQRLKRIPSIAQKLQRSSTRLSQMQDIGGCRAVVQNVDDVLQLQKNYHTSGIKHELVREDDYITTPRTSGYRGIHRVYRYVSDKNETFNGLQIELQFRSRLQHAWATAVETVGTFLRQSLKSSEGSEAWLQFFKLTGSAFALREHTPIVPETPGTRSELRDSIGVLTRKLDVQAKLQSYGRALQIIQQPNLKNARYFLLYLRPADGTITVAGYGLGELQRATRDYLGIERTLLDSPGAEAVLVSAESVESLKRAYPNYFLDTRVFLRELAGFVRKRAG